MAKVYAEMNELNSFQERIETTLSPLEVVSTSQEDTIISTKRKMESALLGAVEDERRSQDHYYEAERDLREAEERVAENNSHLEENQEPMVTPQFYYDNLEECSILMDYAIAKRKRIEETIANFENYVRVYKDEQSHLISQYRQLIRESGTFFEKYIDVLVKAKEAVLSNKESNGNYVELGSKTGTVVSTLDENDINEISNATGWDKELIIKKCSKDGSIYTYRTVNEEYENKLHTSGVFYERSQFQINGLTFEGVFPKFNSVYEPALMPKSLWNCGKYSAQFQYCNQQLKNEIVSNPSLGAIFSQIQLDQIASGKTPSGYTWHHHQIPGKMQLVRKREHNVSSGGAGHTGGGALWCR